MQNVQLLLRLYSIERAGYVQRNCQPGSARSCWVSSQYSLISL